MYVFVARLKGVRRASSRLAKERARTWRGEVSGGALSSWLRTMHLGESWGIIHAIPNHSNDEALLEFES